MSITTPEETAYARRKQKREIALFGEMKKVSHAQLIQYLSDADAMKRRAAVRELHVRNTKDTPRQAMALCRSENPLVRESAALVLGQLKFPDTEAGRETGLRVMTLLCEMAISDPRAVVRAGAMCALGHRASQVGDMSLVLRAAQTCGRDRSALVRYYTAFALGYINLPGAETVLLPLLRDPNKDVRDWAAFAVYMQQDEDSTVYDTPEIRDALLDLARNDVWEIRFEALCALGVLREKRAVPLLAKELDDADGIYLDLATAAGKIGDPSLIPLLEEALDHFGDEENGNGNGKEIVTAALEKLRKGSASA